MNGENSDDRKIASALAARGQALFDAPPARISFSQDPAADELLNDLKRYPHAFVVGCLMDRQMKAERAWAIPYQLSKRIGGFEFAQLVRLSPKRIYRLMTHPDPLHRFKQTVSENLHAAIQIIQTQYDGDASLIWKGRPSSATVVYRFLQFPGMGPKIATMAANILARELKQPMADYYSIDISADVHVKRVFRRLGLIEEDASTEMAIYRARDLHPEFPGMLDLPCWEVGRNWCRPRNPLCSACYLRDMCPSAGLSLA